MMYITYNKNIWNKITSHIALILTQQRILPEHFILVYE